MSNTIGVISDTHGLLRPEAVSALADCAQIIHAGDVGKEEILTALSQIAPLVAVRGNVDREPWTEKLPTDAFCIIGGVKIYVLHDLHELSFDPASIGCGVVISGHSHKPFIERRGGMLYLNPGSAGRRRFSLPVTLAKLEIERSHVEARLIHLLT